MSNFNASKLPLPTYNVPIVTIERELLDALFQPLAKYEQNYVNELVNVNNELTNTQTNGFIDENLKIHYSDDPMLNYVALSKYPHLDKSLKTKYLEYKEFLDNNKKLKLRLKQFFCKVLFNRCAHIREDTQANKELYEKNNCVIDLGTVLPEKLLAITKLKWQSTDFYPDEDTSKDWEEHNQEINRLLAMRAIL